MKNTDTAAEGQRKKLLKELEDRLATTEAKAEQYEAKSLQAAKTVSLLLQVLRGARMWPPARELRGIISVCCISGGDFTDGLVVHRAWHDTCRRAPALPLPPA